MADARSAVVLQCKDCPHWYGGEDYGYGSCRLKLRREEQRFLPFGQQECDEGVREGAVGGGRRVGNGVSGDTVVGNGRAGADDG